MSNTIKAPELAYVALAVNEPLLVAHSLEDDFGLPRQELFLNGSGVPIIGIGNSALALFEAGHPFLGSDVKNGVDHIAIAVSDPISSVEKLGFSDIGKVARGFNNNTQISLSENSTCGVKVRYTEPLELINGSSDMVNRIDHIGVASLDNDLVKDTFIKTVGCIYESEQIDSEIETVSENFTSNVYDNIFHTRESKVVGSLKVTFVTIGDCELEFLQDITPDQTFDEARHNMPGNTRGDRSAIARYIASRGQGLHHIAFNTSDIDRPLNKLEALDYRLIDTRGRPGSRRAQIGFIHPSALGGVLAHFVERDEI